jgi:two-component system sensor histidine kinase UhpB
MNTASLISQPSQFSSHVVDSISDIEKMTDETLRSIRLISHLLHPPLLDESGLLPALRWYIEEFNQRSGIMVQLECDSILPRFPAEIETSLFRIVQECLGNIHRHSASKTALIRLRADQDVIHLEVQDFGRGIPPERVRDLNAGRGGVGIRGMQERVAQFGGAIRLESPPNGTTVKATVPLKQQEDSEFHVA